MSIFMVEGEIKPLIEKALNHFLGGKKRVINKFREWIKSTEGFPFVSLTKRVSKGSRLFIQHSTNLY